MAKARDPEKKTTTRQMLWSDADIIALYKNKKKRYQNQKADQYESDAEVLHRFVAYFVKNNPNPPNEIPVSTYPLFEKIKKE